MKEIILRRQIGGWTAEFLDDLEIYRLFDTNIIPTAFTVHAGVGEVVKAIQALNPEHIVTVGECI